MPNKFLDLLPKEEKTTQLTTRTTNRFSDLVPSETPTNKFSDLLPQPSQKIEEIKTFAGRTPQEQRDLELGLKKLFEEPVANRLLIQGLRGWSRGVETAATAIEKTEFPLVPETSLWNKFPSLLAADFARFYKPEFVIGAQAVGGLLKGAGKLIAKTPVGKLVTKELVGPKWLEKALGIVRYRGTQPKAYQELAEDAALKKAAGVAEAQRVGQILTRHPSGRVLSPSEQKFVGRIFRKQVVMSPKLAQKTKFKELNAIAQEGRVIMDKWSKALVDSGIPSKEATRVIEENTGKYMARMFETRFAQQPGMFKSKLLRLRLGGLKHRKDLSEDVLRILGEIKEPALPTAIRVRELSSTVANAHLFDRVSANPEWVSRIPVQGWTKMPNTAGIGKLRNMWVLPSIAEDVNAVSVASNEAWKVYSKMLSAWKFGKVVLNPATHARNIMSNTMLLDFSGVNHFKQGILAPRVIRDYLTKGPIYQEAKSVGLFGRGFFPTEARAFLNSYNSGVGQSHFQRLLGALKLPFQKLGKLYQFEEDFFKLIKFTDLRLQGVSMKVANQEAQKWIFDYQKIPKIIEFLRKAPIGAPFVTFTYKAIPRIAETAVNKPLKLYKYFAFFNAFNTASAKSLGMKNEELVKEQAALPEYMQSQIPGIPTNLLMPYRDKFGRSQFLNLEYILPVGMAPEIMERGIAKGLLTNPVVSLVGELKSNRDFTGREIVKPGMSTLEANLAMAEHAYRQLMPSFAPPIGRFKGGFSWEKLRDSFQKRGDWLGRVREPEQVIFDVLLGLKVTPIDIGEQRLRKFKKSKREINIIMNELKRTMRHQGISEEEKERQREILLERHRRVIQKQIGR